MTRGHEDPPVKAPWSGGGGRWMVWPLRVVLWVAILVIGYRGIAAIVLNETPSGSSATPPAATPSSTSFPVTLAEAYALQFGQVYLNATPAASAHRQQQLATFISSGLEQADPQLGWNGSGTLVLEGEQVAGINVRSSTAAVVTLLATVNGARMELGVPIYYSGGAIAVSGQPAWLSAPPTAQPPVAQASGGDQNTANTLKSQLKPFFQAYASGDQAALNRYLAPGVSISGLNDTVGSPSIDSVFAPAGGATRDITVTVTWQLPNQGKQGVPELTTTYDMSVVDLQSGKWYVEDIRASTQSMGTQ